MKRLSIVLFLFSCFSVCATAAVTINGYVTDSQSGERLIGASVYDTVSHKGAVTNNSGFYSLTLNAPSAQLVLNVSYVGYRSITTALPMLTGDTLINLSILTRHYKSAVIRMTVRVCEQSHKPALFFMKCSKPVK